MQDKKRELIGAYHDYVIPNILFNPITIDGKECYIKPELLAYNFSGLSPVLLEDFINQHPDAGLEKVRDVFTSEDFLSETREWRDRKTGKLLGTISIFHFPLIEGKQPMPYCVRAYLVLDTAKSNPAYYRVIHDNKGSMQLIIAQEGLERIFFCGAADGTVREELKTVKRDELKRRKGKVQIYESVDELIKTIEANTRLH